MIAETSSRGSGTCVEIDMHFAAHQTIKNISRLQRYREAVAGEFKELAQRCNPLSKVLRSFQPQSVAAVASGMNIGLVAVLVHVLGWPTSACRPRSLRFVTSFRVVGELRASSGMAT